MHKGTVYPGQAGTRTPARIPETKLHIAIVLDEYGGTAGW
jgi:hypothetical protein